MSTRTSRRRLLQGSAALASLSLPLLHRSAIAAAAERSGLAAAYADDFLIGVAVSDRTIAQDIPEDWSLIDTEFNALTCENAMKWERLRPDGSSWFWEHADRLVEWGTQRDMAITGHTLVWHSQVPPSVFSDAGGTPLTRNALLDVMQEHIDTLAGRYRGKIAHWDVVNEGIDEGNGWRRSPWFNQIGDDFMERAFRFAHAADPSARLLYNDYNMHNPQKREFLVQVLREYLDRDVPVHGVGFQTHIGLGYPDMAEWEKSLTAYADLGLKVHITELEIDVLPNPYTMSADISNRFAYSADKDPYRDGLPDAMQEALADRYEKLFRLLLGYREVVERATFWGLYDAISWKNDFPIDGRTNHPLLFDRQRQRKPAYHRLIDLARQV